MKLTYVSKNKRRYLSLGKEFPNKIEDNNTIDVLDDLGRILLMERSGSEKLWKEIKPKKTIKPIKTIETKE